ncbi:hypothetical protein N7499_002983 [Penicillium canescens]|uniref:Uncharacterized protein n=1 Tax=Penicillium canescens TaxID=5083 RepID=A0AAD6IAU6_PENCN|nr:uncharacterized protein N7446_011842 [Penicillium canescens]KAJ6019898.1 hypothetical protein N7522_000606 [Penicillium canescens]KAJ6039222.1 hypothetical protein N7460_007254 [Penicillium canescens]KAJ6047008.1 hypothetical protein N7446_011842 [Penicillium canescens]KAJ6060899.1 hypothetical protein N7444_002753 [Penicillium canescens]KAJ6093652.1 hypothetical protein N7499_002983 [Penicillium canescens]
MTSGTLEEPEPGTRHDWRSAEFLWDLKDSWSFFANLRDAYRLIKLTRKSLLSPAVISQRPKNINGVKAAVKTFRLDSKSGTLSTEEHSTRRKIVYGRYAEVMNYVERWSGEGSTIDLDETIEVVDFVKIIDFLSRLQQEK